jgi:hypothetical protein
MIELSNNHIKEGAKAIADAIKVNLHCRRFISLPIILELKDPNGFLSQSSQIYTFGRFIFGVINLGDEGAKSITKAIKVNYTLRKIFLGGNDIGDEGAKWLADAIKVNSTLQTVDLLNNRIKCDGATVLPVRLRQIRSCK